MIHIQLKKEIGLEVKTYNCMQAPAEIVNIQIKLQKIINMQIDGRHLLEEGWIQYKPDIV